MSKLNDKIDELSMFSIYDINLIYRSFYELVNISK